MPLEPQIVVDHSPQYPPKGDGPLVREDVGGGRCPRRRHVRDPATSIKSRRGSRWRQLECFSFQQIVCFFIDAHPRRCLSVVRFRTAYGKIPAFVSQRGPLVRTSPLPPRGTRMEVIGTECAFGLFSRCANASPSRFRDRDRFYLMGDGGHGLTYSVVARPTA